MSPMQAKDSDPLAAAILERASRRGLSTGLEGMRYANGYLFGAAGGGPARRALYVGVGHGHDALLALIDGQVSRVVGVDPFIATHGNDEDDYEVLRALIADLDLTKRFDLRRGLIQDYRPGQDAHPDVIVINDVLHHIFETHDALRASGLFPDTVALFAHLREIAAPGARLMIGDVSRSGLRPLLGRAGRLHAWIDYATKQNWREWDAAARHAGWNRTGLVNYVPYRFRDVAALLSGPISRMSVCNKYYLYYEY